MSAQDEALRLAAIHEERARIRQSLNGGSVDRTQKHLTGTAAELRRLHAENEHLKGNSLAAAFGIEQGTLEHMSGMADRLATSDALLRRALGALEYHQEQTRPIQRTMDAIAAIKQHLGDET